MSRQGAALSILKKVDAHSEQVALRVYTVSSVADDAKLGELLYKQVFGDPVPWPDEPADHAGEALRARCTAKMIRRFDWRVCVQEGAVRLKPLQLNCSSDLLAKWQQF